MLSHIYTHTIFPRLNTSRPGKSSKTDFNKEMQSFVGAMYTIRLYLYLFFYFLFFFTKEYQIHNINESESSISC